MKIQVDGDGLLIDCGVERKKNERSNIVSIMNECDDSFKYASFSNK